MNAKTPGKVRLVANSHLHVDHMRILDDIAYWDVNSANMYYWGPRQNGLARKTCVAMRST